MGAWIVYVCIAAAVLIAACGGSVSSGQAQPMAGPSLDGGVPHPSPDGGGQPAILDGDVPSPSPDGGAEPAVPAGEVPSLDGGPPRACVAPDAGDPEASEPMAPQYHRASGECCPADRATGGDPFMDTLGTCISDSDCNAGVNGRCLAIPNIFACSYDTCFSDSDCAPRTPCLCRPLPTSQSPNYCAGGSECATDSDCGPGGYCSPSPSPDYSCLTANPPAYYCHTPQDECTNDSDCGSLDAGDPSFHDVNLCLYETGGWACGILGCALP
jgi:hypothetical protein